MLAGKYEAAKEGLLKLGDVPGLLGLYVSEARWDDAFLLLAGHAELAGQVYEPYAKWLLAQDRCAVCGATAATAGCWRGSWAWADARVAAYVSARVLLSWLLQVCGRVRRVLLGRAARAGAGHPGPAG